MNYFLEFLIAIGFGGMAKAGFDFWLERKKSAANKKFEAAIEKISKIYEVMNEIMVAADSSRVVLLRTTNGGGIPRPGCSLYSSIVYEVYSQDSEPIKLLWQSQLLDESYLDIISKTISKKEIAVRTKDLKHGMLKSLYEKRGVVKSYVYSIAELPTEFLYLSVNIKSDLAVVNEMEVLMHVNQIRALFRDYDNS